MNPDPSIVIPLGSGSRHGDLELRLCLRSLAKFGFRAGRVFIMTDRRIDWLQNVTFIPCRDRHLSNKDANLFDKVREYCKHPDATEDFLFWSDDQLLLHPFDLARTEVTFNRSGLDHFSGNSAKWPRRMVRTMLYTGVQNYHFDTHIPQPHTVSGFLRAIDGVDYSSGLGYCFNTLVFGRLGVKPSASQHALKVTCEKPSDARLPLDRRWLGYNDIAFSAGLAARLLALFPEKSKFEK